MQPTVAKILHVGVGPYRASGRSSAEHHFQDRPSMAASTSSLQVSMVRRVRRGDYRSWEGRRAFVWQALPPLRGLKAVTSSSPAIPAAPSRQGFNSRDTGPDLSASDRSSRRVGPSHAPAPHLPPGLLPGLGGSTGVRLSALWPSGKREHGIMASSMRSSSRGDGKIKLINVVGLDA
jgi:hypothetical protein